MRFRAESGGSMRSCRFRRRRSAAASSGEENESRRVETHNGGRRRGFATALMCVKNEALNRAMLDRER